MRHPAHSPSGFPSKGNIGFTLIEVLVVVAILGILVALLLPEMSKWTDKAKGSQCVQRHKNLAIATMAYVADNDGWLPVALDGNNPKSVENLYPYLGEPGTIPARQKVWWCPCTPRETPSWVITSYGMSVSLGGTTTEPSHPLRKITMVEKPSKTALFACIALNYVVRSQYATTFSTTNPFPAGGLLASWHSKGCNVSFLDGHVVQDVVIPNAAPAAASTSDPRVKWWNVNDPAAP